MAPRNRPGTHRPTDPTMQDNRSMFRRMQDGIEDFLNQSRAVQEYDFEEDVIDGRINNPAETPIAGDYTWPEAKQLGVGLGEAYDPNDPNGPVGRFIATFLKHSVINFQARNVEDTYMNNFIVNLHNHNFPIPLPLQYFITDFDVSFSKDAPYASCNFRLQMPVGLAMGIFSGPNAHPEPGSWICVRHLPNDNDSAMHNFVLGGEWAQGQPPNYGEGMTDLQFLGTISSLDWDISIDQNTGIETCSVNVSANSFIHNLMFAEYSIKNARMEDQTEEEVVASGYDSQGNVLDSDGDVTIGVSLEHREDSAASENYYLRWETWLRLCKELASAGAGRVNLKVALEKLIRGLGYPMLPASFQFEPTDFVHFIMDFFSTANQSDIVENMKQLYHRTGPQIGALLINGAISMMEILQIENPILNSLGIQSTAARVYGEFFDDLGNQLYGERASQDPSQGDFINEVKILRQFLGSPTLSAKSPISIGDLCHIATTRDDIPPSHPLWGTMPHNDEPFIDMNKIKNYGMKTTSVWELVTGTFQPDEYIIELFPVILNASNRDVVDFYKAKGISINPFYQYIGGIPTIILRMKPIHPFVGRVGINTQSINAEKLKNRQRGASHFSYTEALQYKPASETVRDPVTGRNIADYKDNSFGVALPYQYNPTVPSSHPDYQHAIAYPPMIHKHEIKSMRFSQTDRARVNSVKVSSPDMANMSGRLRHASEGNMVHNVEMALRHGWRSYNPVWPFAEYRGTPTTRPSAQALINAGQIYSTLSERMYMMMGDDQMYFTGQMILSSQLMKSITPGCWIEVYSHNYGQDRNFLAYVTAITHDYSIDQEDGTLTLETIITFERGSYGGLCPNLPSYKGPTINVQEYLARAGLAEDTAITSAAAARTRTTIPQYEPAVRETSATAQALRAYVALRLSKGDITPAEGQQIIFSGQVPRDDYTLYQTLITRFGGNAGHDPDGTP